MAGETAPRRNLDQEARENLERLRNNPYPGRGIILGHNELGDITQVYWVMGRSTNSRNRVLIQEDDIVRTDLFDKSGVGDTSLIIYNAMRIIDNGHIVSNGDQTDTIAEFVRTIALDGFDQAILTRTYEPDEPNFTPRISGISWLFRTTNQAGGVTSALNKLSIIRRGRNGKPFREFFKTPNVLGIGYCMHTYSGDGNPLPSFVDPLTLSHLVRQSTKQQICIGAL